MRRWWVDAVVATALVTLTAAATTGGVVALDRALRDLADAHRPRLAYDIVVNVNRVGSGGALTAIAVALAMGALWRRRTWWPLAHVAVAFMLVAGLTEPAKRLLHRPPPHGAAVDGLSYPSGHAVNAVVWYGVIVLLLAALGRRTPAAVRWAPPVVVTLTGTYLGFHWLTDMLAGVALGILIDRGLARLPWARPDWTRPRRGQTRITSTPAAMNGATSSSVASSSVTRV